MKGLVKAFFVFLVWSTFQEERAVLLDREQELEAVVEKQKTLNREAMSKLAGNHNIVAGLRAENEKSRALAESSQVCCNYQLHFYRMIY